MAGKDALGKVSLGGEVVPLLIHRPSTRKKDRPTGRIASLFNDEPMRILVPLMLRLRALERSYADNLECRRLSIC